MRPGMDWDSVNGQLDAGYRGILELEDAGRAAARLRVLAEIDAPSPNDFLLLDLGHFILSEDCEDVRAASRALLAIDPTDPLVEIGSLDLFEMGHALATRGDPALLPAFDRMVGPDRRTIFAPAHAMEIDPTLQGVFLYGALSVDSSSHLATRLPDDEVRRDLLLEVMAWIGSSEVVSAAAATAALDGDEATVKRFVSVAMHVGGSIGRDAVLALPRERLSPEAIAYLDSIRSSVERERFPTADELEAAPRIPAERLRTRLQRMIANDGRDDSLDPTSLLVSEIPTAELVAYLRALRVAMLRRVSDEALDEVLVTNRLIHLLGFRDEAARGR